MNELNRAGRGSRAPAWGIIVAGSALVAVAAAWRFTPLHGLLDVERLTSMGAALRATPAAPALVLAGYLAGALLLFPITLLVAATALVFDPVRGFAYALGGALAGAALTFAVGRLVGRFRSGWLSGPRVARLREQLQRRGVLAVAAMRFVPVGNFSLGNMVAGAMGIRFRDYMLGNVIGLLPGILAMTLLAGQLTGLGRQLGPWRIPTALASVAAVAGAFLGVRLLLRQRRRGRAGGGPDRRA